METRKAEPNAQPAAEDHLEEPAPWCRLYLDPTLVEAVNRYRCRSGKALTFVAAARELIGHGLAATSSPPERIAA
jgi:hypothetical protein